MRCVIAVYSPLAMYTIYKLYTNLARTHSLVIRRFVHTRHDYSYTSYGEYNHCIITFSARYNLDRIRTPKVLKENKISSQRSHIT